MQCYACHPRSAGSLTAPVNGNTTQTEASVDQHSSKLDGKTDERLVFDKDQPSEPAGGPNPGRYKKPLPTRSVNERDGRPTDTGRFAGAGAARPSQ
jgi:hypothetical protein